MTGDDIPKEKYLYDWIWRKIYINLSSSHDSQTQEDKLSLYLAMIILINYNQKLLVNGFNVFCSWEQSEKGLKLGDGKDSFLAEKLNLKRTSVQQKGIHPLINSFKEQSRNVYVLSEERKREPKRSPAHEKYMKI